MLADVKFFTLNLQTNLREYYVRKKECLTENKRLLTLQSVRTLLVLCT